MEAPLTPLDFARRARKLYPEREAVVDGALRLTYEGFLSRCDRWSGALQRLGVGRGDRVAYISPNTHRHLESFYAVPQIGAVLVPINFRLTADDFEYIINHCGAIAVCAHSDQLEVVETIRARLPHVRHFVALEGTREGWLDYEELLTAEAGSFEPAPIDERGLLTINYTSGTTSRPKGVMITHRNAYMNVVGTLIHVPMTCADRYLWTLPMFHANGWTFTWIVTAVGGAHICLRKVDAALIFDLMDREAITMLCAAPTVLISVAGAPAEVRRRSRVPVRVLTAGAPPAAATIQRVQDDLGWQLTHVYGLTETSPFITVCESRPVHARDVARRAVQDQGPPGSRADHLGRAARRRSETAAPLQAPSAPRFPGTAGRLAKSSCAETSSWRATTTIRTPRRQPSPAAGSIPVMGRWSIPTAMSRFETGSRTSSSAAARTSRRSKWKACCSSIPPSSKPAVVGVPDAKWGEVPQAFVVLRAGAAVTEDALREFVRSRLAHFKAPRGFTFVPELPKTATGKIQKYVLRQGRSAIAPG